MEKMLIFHHLKSILATDKVQFTYELLSLKDKLSIHKIGGYTVSLNHENTLAAAEKCY